MQIGIVIRETRKRRGLGVRELGRKADIDPGSITRYEDGTQIPNITTLAKLAVALDTEASAMVAQAEGRQAA
jgi:transcriptional regulator with XRE-family HTH domain